MVARWNADLVLSVRLALPITETSAAGVSYSCANQSLPEMPGCGDFSGRPGPS